MGDFVEKTPEELAQMTDAERMSYDIQRRRHLQQTGNQNPSGTDANINFAEKISADAQAGKPGIGKPNTPVTPVTVDKRTPEELINEAYREPLKGLGDYIKDFETQKGKLKEQDEVAKRRSGNLRMIAGISDGLSALANLIGVAGVKGAHASNQTLPGASGTLAQRLEAARLERKTDIKDISDRLDAYKAQRDALRLQKGTALAELEIKREEAQRAAEAAAAANQFDMMKFIMGEEGANARAAAANQSRERAATIRGTGDSGSKTTKKFSFSAGGKGYSIDNASDAQVAEVFAMLPTEIQQKYGKPQYNSLTGIFMGNLNPTRDEMEAAIGQNANDPDFIKAVQQRFRKNEVKPTDTADTKKKGLDAYQ